MYKNVAFAQGLRVLVPKQQLLISFKLTILNVMQAIQRSFFFLLLKKNYKIDMNFEMPNVVHERL